MKMNDSTTNERSKLKSVLPISVVPIYEEEALNERFNAFKLDSLKI